MAEPLFTGVGVALLTLFAADGAVDAPATAELAGRIVECGIASVLVAGSTGEAATLEIDERVALTRAVRAAVPADVPVLVGSGAPSSRQAVARTHTALDAGADGFVVLPPPGSAGLARYYEPVVEAAAGRPVLAYHFPRMSAPGLTVDELTSLPLAGVKDSSGDATRLLEELDVLTPARAVYTGSSALLILAGGAGAAGAILGIANTEPELALKAFGGDVDAQRAVARIERASRRSFPGGLKALTARRFGISTTTRVP